MDTNQNITFRDGWILRKDGEWIPGNLFDPTNGLPAADWIMRFEQYLRENKTALAIAEVKSYPGPVGNTGDTVEIRITFDTGGEPRIKKLDAKNMLMATLGHIRPSPSGWAPFYNYAAAFQQIADEYVSIAKG